MSIRCFEPFFNSLHSVPFLCTFTVTRKETFLDNHIVKSYDCIEVKTMISIHSYFDIDWDATTNNLRTMLNEKTTNAVLADAMYVDQRTISNWLNGSTKLPLSNLIIFARFLHVDLLDIIITKGQHTPLTEADLHAFIRAAGDSTDDTSHRAGRRAPQTEITCKEQFYSTVMLHEYLSQTTSLRNLDKFLLYCPLFDIAILADVLCRLAGNLKFHPMYVRKQLNYLCEHIPDTPAKQYADNYCYFFLMPPFVNFGTASTDKAQIEKQAQYHTWRDGGEMAKQEKAYLQECNRFRKKLNLLDTLKCLIADMEGAGSDYL